MNTHPSGGTQPVRKGVAPALPGTADQLSWQFVTYHGHNAAHPLEDPSRSLERALLATDPVQMAHLLYLVVLGRAPDVGSMAADGLAQGLSPVLLAQSLLDSHEAHALGASRRSVLARDLTMRRFREEWGLPITGDLGPSVTDPHLPLILAGYRVGHGRAPWPEELAAGRRLCAEGLGREVFLRMVWREPGTKARVCGPVRRDVRGAISLVRRPRLLSVFRAHVLAVEAALGGAILSLHLDARPDEGRSTRNGNHTTNDWQTLARVNELSAGVRRLAGDRGW